jgi:hypothetical protein
MKGLHQHVLKKALPLLFMSAILLICITGCIDSKSNGGGSASPNVAIPTLLLTWLALLVQLYVFATAIEANQQQQLPGGAEPATCS